MPNSMFQVIFPGDNPSQGKDKINYNFNLISGKNLSKSCDIVSSLRFVIFIGKSTPPNFTLNK